MNFYIGQFVFSKMGRDTGLCFIIFKLEDGFAYISDGSYRKIENLKKKKIKHLQPTKKIDFEIKSLIENNNYISNSDIKKAIKKYINSNI